MNEDQGWIVRAANEKIDMVRIIRHVTPFSFTTALSDSKHMLAEA
jgi:hypothetical protein